MIASRARPVLPGVLFCNLKLRISYGHSTPVVRLSRLLASVNDGALPGTLVYRSTNRKLVFCAKSFSLFSSATVLAFQPFLLNKLAYPTTYVLAATCGIGFSIVTPLLLHLLTRSHVYELHYDSSTKIFTAYTRGILLNRKVLRFMASDVKYCEPTLSLANISVHGVPLFVTESDFIDVNAYKSLLGFDKQLFPCRK